MHDFKISGSLIQAYYVCRRQVWLMSRKLEGCQDNDFLKVGRYVSDTTYKRDKKHVYINGNIIDVIRKQKDEVLLIETKKSSKHLESSTMQLLFYMLLVRDTIKNITAQIRIPLEKKVIAVILDEEKQSRLEQVIQDINQIVTADKPEPEVWRSFCKTCSYGDLCWS